MKKLLYVLFAIIAITACSKSDDVGGGNNNNNETPKQPEITLDVTASNFTTDGGSSEITFTSSAAWTAEVINTRADAWCSVNPTSGAAGDAKITVTTTANDTPDDRSASIVIKAGTASKTITVSQKQKDALTVTASKFEVGAEGSEVSIEVKANIDFEYAIEESAKGWVEYKTTRALKTSNLVFDVKENDDTEKREAKITIKSGEFSEDITIYQAGAEPTIVISQNEYVVSSDGDTIAVDVASNVDVAIELPAEADWVTENTTRGVSTNTYYFDVAPSEEYDQRTAEIKFTNKENNLSEVVKIVQTQMDAIVLAKSEYEFGTDGGNLDFEIQTNVDVTVTISDDAKDWIQQVETRALETKTLYFNVSACSEGEEREGTITLSGGNAMQTITVKQSGLKEILEKEREALIAFYYATGGDNWINNDNWCSDKPVSEWYGLRVDNGFVYGIELQDNNLTGEITKSVMDKLNSLPKFKFLSLPFNKLTGNISIFFENPNIFNISLHHNKLTGEIPISIDEMQNLRSLDLGGNPLTGEIPESIGNLTNLEYLYIYDTGLTGEIPKSIGNLINLQVINLANNKLTGGIPESIGELKKLLSIDLSWNKLSGEIPSSLGEIANIKQIIINANNLTGKVPESVMNLICWADYWYWIIQQQEDGISSEGLVIPAPEFSATTNDGKTLNSSIYPQNEYTILYNYFDWCPFSNMFTPKLVKLYEGYKDKGLRLIAFSDGATKELYDEYAKMYSTKWPYILLTEDIRERFFSYIGLSPAVNIVDKNGFVVFNHLYDNYEDLDEFLLEKLGEPNDSEGTAPDLYESTDYTADGKVKTLQRATKGYGIDVVLMGDAYSDRLIADGTYDQVMQTAMEKFLEVEPYKSFRDYFNVYSVTAVSKNEVYTDTSETAFAGYFGAGTEVGGNDQRAFYYTEKAVGEEGVDDALTVVMMNSTSYAGTCYMYSSSNAYGDWGYGASVSYFPVGVDANALAQVLHHEAGGHGFSKLADEYAYENMGQISQDEIEFRKGLEPYGWYRNVDFTNDPAKVKWNHFLTDSRYANDGLGVYEGAFTYWTGAYRPTMNSIMNTNVGGFNAPSREAIYYRIHKLAYGADWEYDYEEFVEWDAKNRATTTRGVPYRLEIPEDFKPLHPPVVMKKSWKEATNNAPKKNVMRSTGSNVDKSQNAKSQISLKPTTVDKSEFLHKNFRMDAVENK